MSWAASTLFAQAQDTGVTGKQQHGDIGSSAQALVHQQPQLNAPLQFDGQDRFRQTLTRRVGLREGGGQGPQKLQQE